MARIVNRGFTVTLIVLALIAELALRAAAAAPPDVVRTVYGTTLAMYLAVADRLRESAPRVRVLAMGDSLALTQFQPDTFAADHQLAVDAVFNASYLALTIRSQEQLLRSIGLERFSQLQRVLLFINPRRLTPEGSVDADVFRVAIPESGGPWRQAWAEKRVSPIFDYSRLYGLSRYLVGAAWRQVGRPSSWDEVRYLAPQGGVVFEQSRLPAASTAYPFDPVEQVSEELVGDLRRLIDLLRRRNVSVVLLENVNHHTARAFASAAAEQQFRARMQSLALETGAAWLPLHRGAFKPPADTDFLDYGHLNRAGGIAFTHHLAGALASLPPID